MSETKIMAFLGKGGVGKTALSALTGKIMTDSGLKVLYIDADPAMGLASALDVEGYKTIGQAREEIIKKARISNKEEEKDRLSDIIDYLLLEALYESPSYGLLVMGQTDTLGCYCPLNSLLRNTIETIASQYELIIIDAEAGIEQVNRQVVESVHYPVIVTDNSMRGVRTAFLIRDLIMKVPKMDPVRTGVIFNRVDKAADVLTDKLSEGNLEYYGSVQSDPAISEVDLHGSPIIDIDSTSISLQNLESIYKESGIIQFQ